MADNAAAVALCEKAGFAVEGTRRHSMLVDNSYVDERYMAKLLVSTGERVPGAMGRRRAAPVSVVR